MKTIQTVLVLCLALLIPEGRLFAETLPQLQNQSIRFSNGNVLQFDLPIFLENTSSKRSSAGNWIGVLIDSGSKRVLAIRHEKLKGAEGSSISATLIDFDGKELFHNDFGKGEWKIFLMEGVFVIAMLSEVYGENSASFFDSLKGTLLTVPLPSSTVQGDPSADGKIVSFQSKGTQSDDQKSGGKSLPVYSPVIRLLVLDNQGRAVEKSTFHHSEPHEVHYSGKVYVIDILEPELPG